MSVFNQSRSYIIRILFVLAFLIMLVQLFNLQVVSGKYSKLAMDNAVFPKIVYPERGIIYDRKGKAILNNAIMFDLMVTPAEVKNFDTTSFCRLMEIDPAEFNKRIREAAFKNTAVRPSAFQALLKPQMQARFEERRLISESFIFNKRLFSSFILKKSSRVLYLELNQPVTSLATPSPLAL